MSARSAIAISRPQSSGTALQLRHVRDFHVIRSTEPTAEPPRPDPSTGRRRGSLVWRALAGCLFLAAVVLGGAWLYDQGIDPAEEAGNQGSSVRHELLAGVRSWGYQLQSVDVTALARSSHDLVVVDENFLPGRSDGRRAEALRQLKRKPDGRRRLVLAYLSIGEAESYRTYWDRRWVAPGPARTAAVGSSAAAGVATPGSRHADGRPLDVPTAQAPAWLGEENPEWRGNYRVRYWDEDWQRLIVGSETAALERIIGAGFDGVYLDRADAWAYWKSHRPGAKGDMTTFLETISERARTIAPGFIVVMQNAEELLGQNRLRRALDAVAKEDLLYGIEGNERVNDEREVTSSLRYLRKAQGNGLPVLVVEYLSDPERIAAARRRIEGLGFVPNFAPRALDRLPVAD